MTVICVPFILRVGLRGAEEGILVAGYLCGLVGWGVGEGPYWSHWLDRLGGLALFAFYAFFGLYQENWEEMKAVMWKG